MNDTIPDTDSDMQPSKPGDRNSARIAAVQALYEMDATDASANPVLQEFLSQRWHNATTDEDGEAVELPAFNAELLSDIVTGVGNGREEIDAHIAGALSGNWTVERLELLARAILRAGVYELAHRVDIPVRVVISEYVALAQAFFSENEPALVNGVLDKVARTLRVHEFTDKK